MQRDDPQAAYLTCDGAEVSCCDRVSCSSCICCCGGLCLTWPLRPAVQKGLKLRKLHHLGKAWRAGGMQQTPSLGRSREARKGKSCQRCVCVQACSKAMHWQGRAQIRELFRQVYLCQHAHRSDVFYHMRQ